MQYLILLGYVLAIVDAIAQITDRSGFNIVAGSMTTITQHQVSSLAPLHAFTDNPGKLDTWTTASGWYKNP